MKKNLFAIITMAISIGVLVYFLITTDGITAFAEIAGSIQIPWFISIFAAIIVGWLLEAFQFLDRTRQRGFLIADTHSL